MQTHTSAAGHARARGNFTDMQQVQLLPFDAAEDERSGCETLCSFVGRRRPGRAWYVTRHVDGAACRERVVAPWD
jgi:hypothetical protein